MAAIFDKLNTSTKNILKYVVVPVGIILCGIPLYSVQTSQANAKENQASVIPADAGEMPDADANKTQIDTKSNLDSKKRGEGEELTTEQKGEFDLAGNGNFENTNNKLNNPNNANAPRYNPSNDIKIKPPVKDYYNRDGVGNSNTQSTKSKVYYDAPERDGVTYHDSPKGKKVQEDATIKALRNRITELEQKNKQDSVKPKEQVIMPKYISSDNGQVLASAASAQRFFSANNSRGGIKVNTKKSGKNSVILGEIMESKQVKQQSSIKIKLLEDFDKDGLHIEAGTYLTGLCAFSGSDRVEIKLNSLVINSTLVAIKGDVLDLDGNIGIQIPNLQANAVRSTALSRITSGASSSASPMFFMNAQGGIGQQVAGQVIGSTAGNAINTGQNILMNKLAEFKANLNTGHRVYINITEINY